MIPGKAQLLLVLHAAHKTVSRHRARLSPGSFAHLTFATWVSLLQTADLQQSKLAFHDMHEVSVAGVRSSITALPVSRTV